MLKKLVCMLLMLVAAGLAACGQEPPKAPEVRPVRTVLAWAGLGLFGLIMVGHDRGSPEGPFLTLAAALGLQQGLPIGAAFRDPAADFLRANRPVFFLIRSNDFIHAWHPFSFRCGMSGRSARASQSEKWRVSNRGRNLTPAP